LIATNTIAQGDSRSCGLTWLRKNQCDIYSAIRRLRWPGEAAVLVSVVHGSKTSIVDTKTLDGHCVSQISSYLFHRGGDESPQTFVTNKSLAFSGLYPHGSGFMFDDDDAGATPVSRYQEILRQDPTTKDIVLPYIGGDELLSRTAPVATRFVINFRRMSLEDCERWPQLLSILREKAKPERASKRGEVAASPWWLLWRSRDEYVDAMRQKSRYLVHAFTSKHLVFLFLESPTVVSAPHLAFMLTSDSSFALLQCRVHEIWARFFGSTLEDRLRYTPSDCFDTFPPPRKWNDCDSLEEIGNQYYEHRLRVISEFSEGPTRTYNRFHDPHEKSPEILKLRELHDAMDRAVLEAYGWHDLAQNARCEFLLDYEEDDEETGEKKSKKKKPWRLRWPDSFRDEVLAKLLELNEQRHKEELLIAKQSAKAGKKEKATKSESSRKSKSIKTSTDQQELGFRDA
jgi:hypothetical protein